MLESRKDELSIASHLFAVLREFDEDGVEQIYSESFKALGLGGSHYESFTESGRSQKVEYLTEIGGQKKCQK